MPFNESHCFDTRKPTIGSIHRVVSVLHGFDVEEEEDDTREQRRSYISFIFQKTRGVASNSIAPP